MSEPSIEPLGRRGPDQSGVAYVSSVLESARRLPDEVTVRVVVRDESFDESAEAKAVTAFRDYCRFRAEDAWLQAMTVRRTGARQMPRAFIVAALAAALGAACGSIGQSVTGEVPKASLHVVAGIGGLRLPPPGSPRVRPAAGGPVAGLISVSSVPEEGLEPPTRGL